MLNGLRNFIFLLPFLSLNLFAGVPTLTTLQTRITGPTGAPLEAASVNFRFTILDTIGTCALYVEDYTNVDMTASQGIAAFSLGSGTKTYPPAAVLLVDVFNNATATFPCQAGGSFVPASTDRRQIVMQFNDGSGWQTVPQMAINSVVYSNFANRADSLGNYPASAYLRTTTLPTCGGTQALNYDGTIITCVAASGGAGTTVTATAPVIVSGATSTPVISIPAATAAVNGYLSSADWTTFNNKGNGALNSLTAATVTNTIDNTNFAQTWNWSTANTQNPMTITANALTTGSLLNLTTSNATLNSTNGLLNVANTGASTNGIVARIQSNSTVGSGVTVLANGNVGIGTTTPGSTLEVNGTIGASDGTSALPSIRFTGRTDTGFLRYTPNSGTSIGVSNGGVTKFIFDANGFFAPASKAPWLSPYAGTAAAPAFTFYADTSTGLYQSAASSIGLSVAGVARLNIDSSGNVGIGTQTPTVQLHLRGNQDLITGITVEGIAAGPNFMGRAANGTLAAPTAVTPGNPLAIFSGRGYDGTSYSTFGNGGMFVYASQTFTPAAKGTFLTFTTTANGATSTGERMRIDDAGNVGIGTVSPAAKLDIVDNSGVLHYGAKIAHTSPGGSYGVGLYVSQSGNSASSGIKGEQLATAGVGVYGVSIAQSGSQGIGVVGETDSLANGVGVQGFAASAGNASYAVQALNNSGTGWGVYSNGTSPNYFAGNVGIGTTSPQTTLQVAGVISPATNNTYTLGNATYRFTEVYATNGVINTSDRREKKDIYNTDLGLDFINKLRPVSYRWNTGVDNDVHYGLIAQEAEQVIAEVGKTEKTSIVTHDETTDRYGVRYSELISPLIKSVQELYNRLMGVEAHQSTQDREIASVRADSTAKDRKIEKLKQENAAMKARLDKIEKILKSK